MNSQFDTPLNLTNQGRSVDAHGPIVWDPDESGAEFHVTITQGGAEAVGSGAFADPAGAWVMTTWVLKGGQLKGGSATGSAVARVHTTNNKVETYRWTQGIELQ